MIMPPKYDFLSFKCVAENLTLPSSCCLCPPKKTVLWKALQNKRKKKKEEKKKRTCNDNLSTWSAEFLQ